MIESSPSSPDRPFLETVLSSDSDEFLDLSTAEQQRPSEQGSSVRSAVGNFTNAIAGAGALGLGGAFAKSGGLISIALVIFFAVVTKMSLDMLVHLSIIADVHSFEGLGRLAFGYWGQLAVSISKFMYSFGCLVAYVVVLKDNLGPAVKSLVYRGDEDYDSWWFHFWSESFLVTWTFSSFIILPLCMLRDMTPLANLSMLSIMSMVAIAFILIYFFVAESDIRQPGRGFQSDWLEVKSGTLECLGTFVFTFVSQHTVHLAFSSLRPRLQTYATWKRVSGTSIGIASLISLTIGTSVYVTFYEATESDIFGIYPKGPLVSLAQLLLCTTMLLTFPLPFFACRELIIINMFPDPEGNNHDDNEAEDLTPVSAVQNSPREQPDDESPIIEESIRDSLREPLLDETTESAFAAPLIESSSNTQENDDEESQNSIAFPPPLPHLEASTSFADFSLATAANVISTSVLLPGSDGKQLKLPYHLVVTGKLWFVATGLALAAPNLGDVLDLVGCASGTLIAFVFPSMISLRLVGWNSIAVFLLAVGSLVGSVGTYFSIRQLLEDLHLPV